MTDFQLGILAGIAGVIVSVVGSVLLGQALRRARPPCTGVAAVWCPVHGDCACPNHEGNEIRDTNGDECPLHSVESTHAERSL